MDPPFRSGLGRTGCRLAPLVPASWSFAGRRGPFGGTLTPDDIERSFHELDLNAFFVTPGMTNLAEGVRRLIRAGHRDGMVIISVMGLPTPGGVRRYLDRCTRSLGTDTVDLLLMGWVQHRFFLRPAVWGALQRLKEDGRIRGAGFSTHDRGLGTRLIHELDPAPDVIMIRYNTAHRGAETEIFDLLPAPRPGVLAYTATRWGELLAPRPAEGFPEPMSAEECYRFALQHPAVDAVLCGARNWTELSADARGVRAGSLPAERYREIMRFGDAVHRRPARRSSRYMFRQG